MWEGYEGKYFKGRDFYDWGIDYELQEIIQKFNNDVDTIELYSSSIIKARDIVPLKTTDLDKKEIKLLELILLHFENREIEEMYSIFDYKDAIEKFPKLKDFTTNIQLNDFSFHFIIVFAYTNINFKKVHFRMVLTQLCTIIDECLSIIIKAIGMYYSGIIDNMNIKSNLQEVEKIKNATDLREYFLENALRYEKNFSGIAEKIKFLINKYCRNKQYDYSNIIKMKVQRDCIIHRNNKYDKKAIQILGNKYKENDEIVLDEKTIKKYIDDSKQLINFLKEEIEFYYLGDFAIPTIKL